MAMYDGNIAVVLAGDMDETKEIKKKKTDGSFTYSLFLWGVQRETNGLVFRKVLASKGAVIIGRQNLIQTKA
jgi:hypothetical protein